MSKIQKNFQEAINKYIKSASCPTDKIYIGDKITEKLLFKHDYCKFEKDETALIVVNNMCLGDNYTGFIITNKYIHFNLDQENSIKSVIGKEELTSIKYFQLVKPVDKSKAAYIFYDFILNDKQIGRICIKGDYKTELELIKFINGLSVFMIKNDFFSAKLSNKYIKIASEQTKYKEKELKKIRHPNIFDRYGNIANPMYTITIGLAAAFSLLDVIGIIGLLFCSFEFIQKYTVIFTIIFALCIIFDYFFVRKLMNKPNTKLIYHLVVACLFLLIPIVGFIPARHFWVYNREKELMPEYQKYRLNHPEEKQESTITTSAWKASVIFEESFAVFKLLELSAYI